MPTRPIKNEIMGCEGAFEDILAFFQATPAPSFCTDIEIDRKQIKNTGKSLSEALILGSTNQQYDKRLFST
jgi:hypothetical protein